MIREQILLALSSYVAGMFLVLFYVMLIIVREMFRFGNIMNGITDFVYWECAAVCFFYMIYRINGGQIRGYVFASLFLGMIFFWWAFGKKLLEMLRKTLKKAAVWVNIGHKKIKAIFNKR